MEYCHDYAFGELVFTEDGSFKCPVCGGLTPNQRNLKRGEKIVCSGCESEFKKEEYFPFNKGVEHGVRFVAYGPKYHICLVMYAPSSQNNKGNRESSR